MAGIFKDIIAYIDRKSPTTEAIKSLRTNIQFLNIGGKSKVIAITSSAPEEGKSFVVANLGVVTAEAQKKTLLIDCDLRRAGLSRLFGIEAKEGLSTALAQKEASFKEMPLYDVGIENLTILPSGYLPPNPAELLGAESMDKLLSMMKENFEIIYIDVPPVLSVTDAVIVSKKADGVILVVMANATLVKAAVRSYNILKKADVNLVGTVLNKIEKGIGGYYRYSYSYEKT